MALGLDWEVFCPLAELAGEEKNPPESRHWWWWMIAGERTADRVKDGADEEEEEEGCMKHQHEGTRGRERERRNIKKGSRMMIS